MFELRQFQEVLLQCFLVGVDLLQLVLQLLKGGLSVTINQSEALTSDAHIHSQLYKLRATLWVVIVRASLRQKRFVEKISHCSLKGLIHNPSF